VSIIDALVTRNDVMCMMLMDMLVLSFVLLLETFYIQTAMTLKAWKKLLQRCYKIAEANWRRNPLLQEGVFWVRGQQGRLKEIVAMKKTISVY
jgi:glycine C-acetyltransferase